MKDYGCERCGNILKLVDSILICSCASRDLKAKIGYCIGVHVCEPCYQELHIASGGLLQPLRLARDGCILVNGVNDDATLDARQPQGMARVARALHDVFTRTSTPKQ